MSDGQGFPAVSDGAAGERREQILAAAWVALTEAGFENITTRRLAEAAGVNIATLHYYFGNKEALLTETLRYAQRWAEARMRAAVAPARTAGEAMERAVAVTWELMASRPGILRFDLAVRGFRDADARREAAAVYGAYRGFVREIVEWHVRDGGAIRDGLASDELAHYVVCMVDGILLHHTLDGDDRAARRNLSSMGRQIFEMLGLPPAQAAIGAILIL